MTTDVATVDVTSTVTESTVVQPREPRRRGAGRLLTQFVLAGLAALVALGALAAYLSRRAGTSESIRDVKARTQMLLQAVWPTLNGTVTGDAESFKTFDSLVTRLIEKGQVRHVRVWAATGTTGTVKYSDQPGVANRTFELRDDALKAFRTGEINAEVNNLTDPENQIESRIDEKLLEVYAPFKTSAGTTMLFETYTAYTEVTSSAQRMWIAFAPTVMGALLALQLIQIPLAGRLARRLRDAHAHREQALGQALDASDTERRRISRDLHDGAVQELAGVSYSLAVVADRERQRGDHEAERMVRDSIVETRRAIQGLRSLVVEIYPPNLASTGLGAALDNLTAPMASRGVDVTIDVPEVPLPADTNALLFRLAQESLRNVARHSGASAVSVVIVKDRDTVVMSVRDNGVGFDMKNAGPSGHFGLRIMNDLVAGADGRLSIDSAPGTGTLVRVEVPLP
jgi:two-component system, NarL family, sensor kinase